MSFIGTFKIYLDLVHFGITLKQGIITLPLLM